MFPVRLYRLVALAAMLSGLFIIIKKLVVELLLPLNPATNAVGTAGLLLGLFALTGIYLYERQASGSFGLVSYLVNWFGLGAVAGVDYARNYILPYLSKSEVQALLAGPTRLAFIACALFFLVGVVLFSAASLRAGVFPRLAIVLYLIGFTVYSLSFFLPYVVVVIAEVSGAVGIIWLGYALWVATRKAAAMPPSSQPMYA